MPTRVLRKALISGLSSGLSAGLSCVLTGELTEALIRGLTRALSAALSAVLSRSPARDLERLLSRVLSRKLFGELRRKLFRVLSAVLTSAPSSEPTRPDREEASPGLLPSRRNFRAIRKSQELSRRWRPRSVTWTTAGNREAPRVPRKESLSPFCPERESAPGRYGPGGGAPGAGIEKTSFRIRIDTASVKPRAFHLASSTAASLLRPAPPGKFFCLASISRANA